MYVNIIHSTVQNDPAYARKNNPQYVQYKMTQPMYVNMIHSTVQNDPAYVREHNTVHSTLTVQHNTQYSTGKCKKFHSTENRPKGF